MMKSEPGTVVTGFGFAYKVRNLSYVLFVSFSVVSWFQILNFGNQRFKTGTTKPREITRKLQNLDLSTL